MAGDVRDSGSEPDINSTEVCNVVADRLRSPGYLSSCAELSHTLGIAMAGWQVNFIVVPRRALAALGALTTAALDQTDSWVSAPFPADYATRLASLVTEPGVRATDHDSWGREDGNRVDVWLRDGRVTKMTVRVDVRRLDSKFGASLIEFARRAGAVFIRSDGLIIEPLIGAYAAALRSSDAWRFANPQAAPSPSPSSSEDDED